MNINLSRIFLVALTSVAFTLTAHAQYQYKTTTLYSFTSKTDGEDPTPALVMDQNGNIYGATTYGGSGGCGGKGCGSVFELSPNGSGIWTKTELFGFNGTNGFNPVGNLLIDASGNLYGTTLTGGTASGASGVVFELSPSNGSWTETSLYNFSDGTDGGYPLGLTFDGKGNIFGSVEGGGANSYGGVYELSPNGSGGWNESVIYSFTNGDDGANPWGSLAIDSAGNLYGAARFGGGSTACSSGCGTIYRLRPSASGWLFSRLYAFEGPGGGNPNGSPILDSAGNLYASTYAGGHGYGVSFKLAPKATGSWTETLLHDFTDNADGEGASPLIADSAGNLYGGSSAGQFRIAPSGTGFIFEMIAPSSTSEDGVTLIDSSGNLYGTTITGAHGYGSVYQITPP